MKTLKFWAVSVVGSLLFAGALLYQLTPVEAQRESSSAAAFATVKLECKHLHVISQGFLHNHIKFKKMTPELEGRTIEQYVKKYDPFKIYLLASDVENMKKGLKGIYGQIENQKCDSLSKVNKLFIQRMEERLKYVKSALGPKFKYDKSTQLVLDSESRKYPKTKKEAEAFHAKYLQFQISNQLATGLDLEESKKHVIRSYERAITRMKKQSDEDIFSEYLDAFARSLDPHSSYFSNYVLEDFEIQMRLQLEGIGATLSSQDGFTVVEQLVPGGAAAKSGLIQPNDRIIAVGQVEDGKALPLENVVEMDLRDVVRKIRGNRGTKVRLKILRKTGEKTERTLITLTRDRVNLEDEAASLSFLDREVNGVKRKLAVIQLPSFYADARRGGRSSAEDVKKLLKKAREAKADGVLLDLSTNGGGSLDDAVNIVGLFIKTGNVVKQTTRKTAQLPDESAILQDTDSEVHWAGPLTILTSRVSASASEIVAGALQDYDRAVVVGSDHTFGKGTVQQVVQLPPGLGAIKVTVGMFFTPGGWSTQHRGVNSDIEFPFPYATLEIGEKELDHSLQPQRIHAFLSESAQSKESPWNKISPEVLTALKQSSAVRVARSEKFNEILEENKKAKKEEPRVISLSETFEERKELKEKREQSRTQSKEEKLAEYLAGPEITEAANILVDLIDLQNKVKLSIANENAKSSAKEKL